MLYNDKLRIKQKNYLQWQIFKYIYQVYFEQKLGCKNIHGSYDTQTKHYFLSRWRHCSHLHLQFATCHNLMALIQHLKRSRRSWRCFWSSLLHIPNTLCYRPHGLLGYKHVTGKPVQHGMLGDEAKVAAETQKQGRWDGGEKCRGERQLWRVHLYQLFLGWHPQNEMFFIWKKWLHLSYWKWRTV